MPFFVDRHGTDVMAETRTHPFLILLRAGNKSLHPTWMEPPATRNWDMHILFWL